MRQLCTDKELKEKLKALTVIIDSREQVNEHIVGYFNDKGIPYVSRKLDIGDYSFQHNGSSYQDEVVIERKNSIDEIAGNFTINRTRFENEFLRAKANGTKVFLVIENCSWGQISSHDYRSGLAPTSLKASLMSWQIRYGITVNFCSKNESAEIIHAIAYYWLRERLVM